jgi:two-component system KDP operon response regulator KdpE
MRNSLLAALSHYLRTPLTALVGPAETLSLDLSNRRVTKNGADVHLTQIEFRLLGVLLSYPDKVLTHRQLLRDVGGPLHAEHSHYLRIYMGH